MRLRFVPVIVVYSNLAGCMMNCESEAIPGQYRITQESRTYHMWLNENGKGLFGDDVSPVRPLTWEHDRATGQILLNIGSEALDILRSLIRAEPPPPNAIQAESGYFAISPKCDWRGRIVALDLDEDGASSFKAITVK